MGEPASGRIRKPLIIDEANEEKSAMPDKKYIAFLNACLYPCDTGGIELFHHFFIRAISTHFPALVLTTCKHPFSEPNVETLNISSPFGRGQTPFTIYYHTKYLLKHRNRIRLIHIPYSSGPIFQYYHVMMLARALKIPYILRIHGGGMYPGKPDFLHSLYFKNASGIIGVSKPIKDEYERRYGMEISLIPSYLPFLSARESKDMLRKRHRLTNDQLVFLFLGSVKKIKGADVLVEAVLKLGKDYFTSRDIVILVVGGGDMLDGLRKKIGDNGLGDVVRFEGQVPYEHVHEYYALADVFVIPSLMEARPLALAEALYNGLPAIGSNIPTISNTIRDQVNGILAAPGDADSLNEAIRLMADDRTRRENFAKKSREEKEQFNKFDSMVLDYVRFYDKIMRRNGA